MAAMADFHGGFSKKRHRIAVAWRVWDGGAMAAAIAMAVVAVMAGWRKMASLPHPTRAPSRDTRSRTRTQPRRPPAATHRHKWRRRAPAATHLSRTVACSEKFSRRRRSCREEEEGVGFSFIFAVWHPLFSVCSFFFPFAIWHPFLLLTVPFFFSYLTPQFFFLFSPLLNGWVYLNSLMSLFGVGTWLLYELMKLF